MTTELFHLGDVQLSYASIDRNEAQRPKGWTPAWVSCVICGRPLDPDTATVHVLMDDSLNLLPAGEEPDESFTSYPIGSTCVKKIPKNYRQ